MIRTSVQITILLLALCAGCTHERARESVRQTTIREPAREWLNDQLHLEHICGPNRTIIADRVYSISSEGALEVRSFPALSVPSTLPLGCAASSIFGTRNGDLVVGLADGRVGSLQPASGEFRELGTVSGTPVWVGRRAVGGENEAFVLSATRIPSGSGETIVDYELISIPDGDRVRIWSRRMVDWAASTQGIRVVSLLDCADRLWLAADANWEGYPAGVIRLGEVDFRVIQPDAPLVGFDGIGLNEESAVGPWYRMSGVLGFVELPGARVLAYGRWIGHFCGQHYVAELHADGATLRWLRGDAEGAEVAEIAQPSFFDRIVLAPAHDSLVFIAHDSLPNGPLQELHQSDLSLSTWQRLEPR